MDQVLNGLALPANMAGREQGARLKDWNRSALRVVLAQPDIYEASAGSTALNILYQLVNRHPAWLAERSFLWPTDFRKQCQALRVTQFSLESKHALRDFDLIGISMPSELLYPNLVQFLNDAGLNPWSEQRKVSDPLVAVGGVASFNPLPIAPLVDAVFIGEAEESFVEVLEALEKIPQLPRSEKLLAISRVPGVYVPSVHGVEMQTVSKRSLRDLSLLTELTEPVIPYGWEKKPRASLQLMRGCVWKCRYCQAGFTTLPVRSLSAAQVQQTVDDLRGYGIAEVGLLALNVIDYPQLPELLTQLHDHKGHLRMPAIKMDYVDPNLVRNIGYNAYSLALEAGTERLRHVLNRRYTDADWQKAVDHILKAGGKRISMDFMVGLPTETDADLMGIAETVSKIAECVVGQAELSVSVATFVPKPHTPFQWHVQILPDEARRRQEVIRTHALHAHHVQYHFRKPDASLIEGVLARGTMACAALLVEAVKSGVVDLGWEQRFISENWQSAAAAVDFDLPALAQQTYASTENLPWEVINVGVQKKYLLREWEKSLATAPTVKDLQC